VGQVHRVVLIKKGDKEMKRKGTINCAYCSEKIQVNSIKVRSKEVVICDENIKVTLSYFKCPHCNKENHVAIDDKESLEIMNKVKRLLRQTTFIATIKKAKREQLEEEANKLIVELKERRKALLKYNKSFYQYDDYKEQLDISLPEATKNLE
jgi:DNA-directed RNA polymerase subunit RPC12/RpoP